MNRAVAEFGSAAKAGRVYRTIDEAVFRFLLRYQKRYLDAWVHTPKADYEPRRDAEPSPVEIRDTASRGLYRVSRYNFNTPVKTGYAVNDAAYGLVIDPRRRVRGTIVVLHGWMLRSELTLKAMGLYFAARGYRCFLPVFPFHLKRRVRGTFDGQLMIGTDTRLMRLAFEQATAEVLHLISFVRERYGHPCMIVGGSLGGLVASHVISKDGDLDRAYILVAGANLARSVMNVSLFNHLKEAFAKIGADPETTRVHLAETDPVMLAPVVPKDRIQIHGGLYDPVFDPESVGMLADAWGIEAHFHRCGHTTIFTRARSIFRDL